jgi:hypothetical protein
MVVGTSYQVGITATSEAASIIGATVTAVAATGRYASNTAVTNSLGQANFLYSPQTPGTDTLNFTLSLQGFAAASIGVTVHVDAYYTVTAKLVDETSVGVAGVTVNLVDAKGEKFNGTSAADGTVSFNNVFWGNATISVPNIYQTSSAKYTLTDLNGQSGTSTSFPVLSDVLVTAKYQTSYLVTVISAYGTTAGSGEFNRGTLVTASVAPTTISSGFLTSKKFAGWAGTVTGTNATIRFVLNGPAVMTAKWTNDATALYILIGVIVAIVVVAIALFWFIRKRRASTTEPQKEEEFKD